MASITRDKSGVKYDGLIQPASKSKVKDLGLIVSKRYQPRNPKR